MSPGPTVSLFPDSPFYVFKFHVIFHVSCQIPLSLFLSLFLPSMQFLVCVPFQVFAFARSLFLVTRPALVTCFLKSYHSPESNCVLFPVYISVFFCSGLALPCTVRLFPVILAWVFPAYIDPASPDTYQLYVPFLSPACSSAPPCPGFHPRSAWTSFSAPDLVLCLGPPVCLTHPLPFSVLFSGPPGS